MANLAEQIKTRNLIAARRSSRKAGGRRQRLRRPPRIPWPAGVERSYRKSLLNIVSGTRAVLEARLMPELERLVELAKAERPRADNARVDAYGDEITRLMALIRSRVFGQFSESQSETLVSELARAISSDNKRGIGGVFKSVLGVDLFAAEPWLGGETRAFVEANVSLIRTIPEQYLGQVEQIVRDGTRRATSWREIASDLRDKPFYSSRYRAERIARDQVGKFNGQLAELRQVQAGVSRYIWRTSKDERVREEHKAREGQAFSWSSPPEGGHPGEDFGCRCYAEPVLEDLLPEADE